MANLEDVLSRLQHVRRSGGGYTARCPAHDDRVNSLSLKATEGGRMLLKCHAGCETKDIVEAMGMRMHDIMGTEGDAPNRGGEGARSIACTYPYHGADGTLLFEVVRTQPKGFYQRRPDGKGGYVVGLGDCDRVLYRLPEVLEAVRAGLRIVLCEGEKDVERLRAHEEALGFRATTAPMGAGKWRDAYTDALRGADVLVVPDIDEAGRKHAETVKEALHGVARVRVCSIEQVAPALAARKGADVSDYLDAERSRELEAVQRLLATDGGYRYPSIAEYVEGDFWAELAKNRGRREVRTGFEALDVQLGGRLYAGLFVIGSISSLGKSAFVGQMADAIAAQGEDVLFFTLEMARYEMMARSLSRVLYMCDPMRYRDLRVSQVLYGSVEDGDVRAAAREIAEGFGRHIAYVEGNMSCTVSEIARWVRDHAESRGKAPVVFVDYLQILRGEGGGTDKQMVDENVIELKRLSRTYDTPVIAVSSFNRQNYGMDASFSAFKESGAIEYSADLVMALQARGVGDVGDKVRGERDAADAAREIARMTRQAKVADPRPIEAVVLKNRRGASYARMPLNFYPRQNYFEELRVPHDDANMDRWLRRT